MPFNLEFKEKLGVTLIQLQRASEGIAVLEWVLSENPKRSVALCNAGFGYVLQGDYEKGEAYYDRAIALDPDYEQALMNKAALRLLAGDKEAARMLLQNVLRLNPENQQAQHVLYTQLQ
jgi:protein O-GlcNAc transferase